MRIVIVDGSRVVLRLLTELLHEQGHQVDSFTNGQDALSHILANVDIDVLITSFEIPGKSGLELCWETRIIARKRRPIYVIAMSSTKEKTKLIQALDSGADDFFSKPPVPEELRARIRAAQRLIDMQNELVRLATRDPLTDILNRRAFFEAAETLVQNSRSDSRISAVMFDIDHFKSVNDRFGHDIGDQTIRAVTEACTSDEQIFGRLGGEEFAIVFNGMDQNACFDIAEEYRKRISQIKLQTERGTLRCTCSFGVSELIINDTLPNLLKRADTALYFAKNNGRNQVAIDGL